MVIGFNYSIAFFIAVNEYANFEINFIYSTKNFINYVKSPYASVCFSYSTSINLLNDSAFSGNTPAKSSENFSNFILI